MPNTNAFTLDEINQILEQLNAHPGARLQYIGSRYVPIFGRRGEDSIEWDNTGTYEPLTIVLYQGNSYTSRQFVPVGIEITNQKYWANTGNYNAQIEQYRQEVNELKSDVNDLQNDVSELSSQPRPYIFNNVQDASSYQKFMTGNVLIVLGYYSPGDGGECIYEVSNEYNDYVVNAYNNLYLNPIPSGIVYPEQFGAKGDGTTNDYQSIQKALNYAVDNNCVLTFVKKTYKVDSTLILNNASSKYIQVNGYGGEYYPTLLFDGINICFDIQVPGVKLNGFKIKSTNAANCTGIKLSNTVETSPLNLDCEFFQMGFSELQTQVSIVNGFNIKFSDCSFGSASNNVESTAIKYTAQNTTRGLLVENCRFHGVNTCFDFTELPTGVDAASFNIIKNNFMDFIECVVNGNCCGAVFDDNIIVPISTSDKTLFTIDNYLSTNAAQSTKITNNIINCAATSMPSIFSLSSTYWSVISGNIVNLIANIPIFIISDDQTRYLTIKNNTFNVPTTYQTICGGENNMSFYLANNSCNAGKFKYTSSSTLLTLDMQTEQI